MATRHSLDGSKPSSNVGGRPPAWRPEHIAVLHEVVTERTQAGLREIAHELQHRCGRRAEICRENIRGPTEAMKCPSALGRYRPVAATAGFKTSNLLIWPKLSGAAKRGPSTVKD